MKLNKKHRAFIMAVLLLPVTVSATTTLKYIDHEPLGGMRTQFIHDVFFPAIEKESQGRLKIDAHWGGEVAKSYDELRVVGEGSATDMAIVVPEYTPKELPLHQIFKSFPVGPVDNKQVAFFRQVYASVPAFPAELNRANVVNLFFATGFPVAFFSTQPLNSLDGMKGEKWRSASFWHQDFLRNAGAIPVSMPWNDGIYKALQAGTLDGLMVNVDSGYELQVHKIAPYILLSKDLWLGHIYLLVMNKDTWNRLAKEDQDAIQRAAGIAYETLGAVMATRFDAQVESLTKDNAKVRLLQQSEVQGWKAATGYRAVQDAWVKEREAAGMTDARPVMDEVTAIMNEAMK